MQTQIKKINIPEDKRLIFISDIHANIDSFQNLLEEIYYKKGDYLFILGDMIEKGQSSLKTLDYIIFLIDQGYNVNIVKGNCDEVLENMNYFSKEELLEYKTFQNGKSIINEILTKEDISIDDITQKELYALIKNRYSKYYNFLKNLNHVLIINDLLYLSHGGIDDISNISSNKEDIVRNQYFYSKDIVNKKIQVVGHLPVFNYDKRYYNLKPIIDLDKKIISIDGGNNVAHFYQLNALIIDNLKDMNIEHKSYDHYKKVQVKENYQGNERESFNLKFDKYYLEIISEDFDYYLVKLNNNEKKLYVHKNYIYYDYLKRPFIYDGTDLFLTLKKGDKVSLCLYAKPYSIIKKDDVVGFCLTNILDV